MLKGQKGITLVALVITIIVLIILAAVSISAAYSTGLIGNAKTARDEYQNAKDEEEAIVYNYMNMFNEETNGLID